MDGTELYVLNLSGKQLTDKQRKARCISSGCIGTQVIRRVTRDNFFGEDDNE